MAIDNTQPPDLAERSGLRQKDKIQILLSEYTTLRSEILTRTGYGFQLAGLAAVIGTWLLAQTLLKQTQQKLPLWFWIVLAVTGVFFAVATFANVRDLTRAANRVKDLEHEINSRAGESLLVWETLSGVLTRMGLIRSFFSFVKPLPRSKLPALDPSYLDKEAERLAQKVD
jgi:prepilin signal peptidase PulO-like enzyme (type II secretory pathway)